jgi:hypothetical protein
MQHFLGGPFDEDRCTEMSDTDGKKYHPSSTQPLWLRRIVFQGLIFSLVIARQRILKVVVASCANVE